MKKITKKLSALLIVCMLCSCMMPMQVDAKTKSTSIKKVSLKIKGKKVTKKTYLVKKGTTVKLKVSVTPSKAKKSISYKSSNKKVATVSKGKIKAKKVGTSKIFVTVKGKKGKAKKTWVKIKVVKKLPKKTGNNGSGTSNPSKNPQQKGDGNDSGGSDNSDDIGDITRQQWISDLMDYAGMDMYNTSNDSSFSDVSSDSRYAWAIEMALQNNVITQNEKDSNKFYPEKYASEIFAVETSVRALGFEYANIDECIKIAQDTGLVDVDDTPGKSLLTNWQSDAILEQVAEIAMPPEIDPNAEQIVETSAVNLDSVDNGGDIISCDINEETMAGTLILKPESTVSVGNCVMIPDEVISNAAFPYGLAQEITEITVQDDKTLLVATILPSLDDLMGEDGEINIQGVSDEKDAIFEVSDTADEELLELMSLSSKAQPKISISKKVDEDGRKCFEVKAQDESKQGFYGTVKIYSPTVDYKADIKWFGPVPTEIKELYLALDGEAKVSGGLQATKESPEEPKSIKLGEVKIPLSVPAVFADIELYLKWSVTGKIELEYSLKHTLGIQYKDGHMRKISRATTDLDFKPLEVEGKIGPEVSANLELGEVVVADVAGSIGAGASGTATIRDLNNICVDGTVFLYAELEAMDKSILNKIPFVDLKAKWEIWGKENSIMKKSLHFEGTEDNIGFVKECTFGEGDITGTAIDAVTKVPLHVFAAVAKKTDGNGAVTGNATLSANGGFNFSGLPAGKYSITITASGYHPHTKENVAVRKNQVINLGSIRLVPEGVTLGSASGYIINSQNGEYISGAEIKLYEGTNTSVEPVMTVTSESDGQYSFSDIKTGQYTIIVSHMDYSTESSSINVTEAGESNQNVTLIPNGVDGDYDFHPEIGTYSQIGDLRIVLTWGEEPSDLDSHLCGPTKNGASRFHVYYSDRYYEENGKTFSYLDHDDTSSYGPETTTVYDMNTSGKYSFYVHDYTNGGEEENTMLSSSEAIVRAYVKEDTGRENSDGEKLYRAKLIDTYHVPANKTGTLWHVFDYNAATGVITPRNIMSVDSGSTGDIGMYNTRQGANTNSDDTDLIDKATIMKDIKNKKK